MSLLESLVKNDNSIKDEYLKARESFWEYCKLRYPKHYKESRPYQKRICEAFQALYEGRIIKFGKDDAWQIVETTEGLEGYTVCKKMMLNVPPRHYKSFTASLFSQWVLGKNNENTIITCSYNETLSTRFGKAVRDGIDETKLDPKRVIFNDIFPTTHIKYGDSAASLWSLEGQFFNYLATSFNGTVTGIGCKIGIIDDQIKTADEAHNENLLNGHWEWHNDTWLSRLEEGAIQIIIMTRWSTKDICGRLLEIEPEEWFEMKLKAVLNFETGEMLCPEILSFASYTDKTKPGKMSPEIALANYQQEPVDAKGRLYAYFKTYKDLPRDDRGNLLCDRIINYTDTADEGSDKLCSICAVEYKGEGFVIDVLFSGAGMEVTEPATAKMLVDNKVNLAMIESNNGGKGFARNVERIIWTIHKTRRVIVRWFHQSANKISRILSGSTFVMEHIYFPWNWAERWPEYYKAMCGFQREGKNKHDDAPDATTGLGEMIQGKRNKKGSVKKPRGW
jgi:predicted phage terminase large subunit-like protein